MLPGEFDGAHPCVTAAGSGKSEHAEKQAELMQQESFDLSFSLVSHCQDPFKDVTDAMEGLLTKSTKMDDIVQKLDGQTSKRAKRLDRSFAHHVLPSAMDFASSVKKEMDALYDKMAAIQGKVKCRGKNKDMSEERLDL